MIGNMNVQQKFKKTFEDGQKEDGIKKFVLQRLQFKEVPFFLLLFFFFFFSFFFLNLIDLLVVRGHQSRLRYYEMRKKRAIAIIYKFLKRNVIRRKYYQVLQAINRIQVAIHIRKSKKLIKERREWNASLIIQKCFRRFSAQQKYQKDVKLVIWLVFYNIFTSFIYFN